MSGLALFLGDMPQLCCVGVLGGITAGLVAWLWAFGTRNRKGGE